MACPLVAWCTTALWVLSPGVPDVPGTNHDAAGGDTVPVVAAGPVISPAALAPMAVDTIPRRRAVSISDGYARRLTIHRYGSYAMLPLFAGQYVLGRKLLQQKDGVFDGTRRVPIDAGLRRTHRNVGIGVGTLFAVNTTTGLWNLWEARHDGSHSGRRTAHVLAMLGADAGFVVTGMLASRAVEGRPSDARAHRNVALASMGLATIGATLMWF